MKRGLLFAALAAASLFGVGYADAASFTYHGNLQDAGKPADGKYDMELTLYSAKTGGSVIGGPLTLYAVTVRDGSFSTDADFGPLAKAFSQAYVGVKVRTAGTGGFVPLTDRASVTPDTNTSCPGSWSLDGNAGNPATSYLGTSDASDVVIKSNGQEAGRFGANQSFSAATAYSAMGSQSTALSDGLVKSAGSFAFSGGANSTTNNSGSFVWGDSSGSGAIEDTAENQFIVQASGGMGINAATDIDGTSPLARELTIAPRGVPGPLKTSTIEMRATDAGNHITNMLLSQSSNFFQLQSTIQDGTTGQHNTMFAVSPTTSAMDIGGADFTYPFSVDTANQAHVTSTGIWTNASSRSFKEDFGAIDPMAVLEKLAAMPVQTWFYKNKHGDGLHMGPVAEDFAKTFGLGSNDKYIGTSDEDGVALAAIQGLNKKVEAENFQLKSENAVLQRKLDNVLERLSKLEAGKGH